MARRWLLKDVAINQTWQIFSLSLLSEVVVVVVVLVREDRDEMGKGDFQKQYRAGRQVGHGQDGTRRTEWNGLMYMIREGDG